MKTKSEEYTLDKFISDLTGVIHIYPEVKLCLYDVNDCFDYFLKHKTINENLSYCDSTHQFQKGITSVKIVGGINTKNWKEYKDLIVVPSLELIDCKTFNKVTVYTTVLYRKGIEIQVLLKGLSDCLKEEVKNEKE